jgi:hypothetical protein
MIGWDLSLQVVHEYGRFAARNPGSFDRDHFLTLNTASGTPALIGRQQLAQNTMTTSLCLSHNTSSLALVIEYGGRVRTFVYIVNDTAWDLGLLKEQSREIFDAWPFLYQTTPRPMFHILKGFHIYGYFLNSKLTWQSWASARSYFYP